MNIPDCLGYQLESALHLLNKLGYDVIIEETYGKRSVKTEDVRVIRQKLLGNNQLQLIIAYF